MLSVTSRSCCSCCNSGPAQDQICRTAITSSDLAELIYIAGLDENLCEKFQAIAEITNLRDCAGNPIARTTPIVTCADFQARLCATFALLEDAGPLVLEGASVGTPTLIVGADCDLYSVPETLLTVVDTNCINLTASGEFGHTLTATLVISPDAGNMLSCTANGAYADETPLVANDSATIDFTTSGFEGHTLTGSVKISAVPNNCVIAQADGIYVECTDLCDDIGDLPVGAASVPGVSSFVGSDCQTHVLTETPIVVVDTLSVDLTSSGSFGHTVQADVRLDSDPDNLITITAGGLLVDCADVIACVGAQDPLLVADTITVDLTINPGVPQTLSADVKVSAVLNNDLSIQPDGLYVSVCNKLGGLVDAGDATPGVTELVGADCQKYTLPASIATDTEVLGDDTNCISVSVVEAPAGTFTVSATPIIDPDPGNILTCGVDGLLVLGSSSTQLVASDTNCINMSAVEGPADTWTVSAQPIIAPNHTGYPVGCNGLECTGAGLSTPPDTAITNLETGLPTPAIFNEAMSALESFTSPVIDIDIENPSDCRDAILRVGLRVPETQVQQAAGAGRSKVHFLIEHNVNLPGVLVTAGFITKTEWVVDIDAPGAGTREWMTPGFDLIPVYTLPAGFTGGNIQWRITITQEEGTSTNVRVNAMVIRGDIVAAGN